MQRRLFWTIAGVAAVTGFVALVGTVFASQRAAVEATERELTKSSQEVVFLIEESIEQARQRPFVLIELVRFLEGEQARPALGRIGRAAGSSAIAFGVIGSDGVLASNNDLFADVEVNEVRLLEGKSQFVRSVHRDLVLLTPVLFVNADATITTLVVGLARETPLVLLSDMGLAVVLIGVAVIGFSALFARLLSDQIPRQLEPLSVASRELASGDLTSRVPDLGDPELDDVASAFNEMAATLEATSEREREFLLGVGHDLRTPLTTIGGYAEALESGDVDSEEIARIGAVLSKQTEQLRRLIEDLSLLARLDQPEFDLRMEQVEIVGHISEIVEGYQMKASDAGVALTIESDGPVDLETDPDRLAQMVQNLLENALRFTPVAGSVVVSVTDSESGAVVAVADTGIGIDPEEVGHIFDRHYVGRQRRIRNEGSGLGLSIVKGLTDRLGGKVDAESKPGRGTTVTVTLPGTVTLSGTV